jgi:hypothetical protein
MSIKIMSKSSDLGLFHRLLISAVLMFLGPNPVSSCRRPLAVRRDVRSPQLPFQRRLGYWSHILKHLVIFEQHKSMHILIILISFLKIF